MTLPIAVQLYTVRDLLAKDLEGTLRQIARIGLKNVELAGLYNHSPQDVRRICDGLGLNIIAAHVTVNDDPANLQTQIETAKVLGYRYVGSGLPKREMRDSSEGYRQALHVLSRAATKLSEGSLTYCYHNHSFEYDRQADGQRGMDVLFDGTDLMAELDVYWVQHGNDDPIAWMNKLAGRVPLLHVKDMDNTPERKFAEVGTGILDMPAIIALAPTVGVNYLIIEQDRFWIDDDPIKSVAISFENLSKLVR
jgi:sugar phosphate isomerase/epimerase